MPELMDCEQALYNLHQVGGAGVNNPLIEVTSPTKGRVNNTLLQSDGYPYSLDCFSDECFDLPGVWTDYPMTELPPPSPPYLGCYEEGVYQDCTLVCSVEVLVPYLACFEGGAFDDCAYNYQWRKEVRYISPPNGQPCFPPGPAPDPSPVREWEPYLFGRTWGQMFTRNIFSGGPAYQDCFSEACFLDTPYVETPNSKWLVVNAGPYEDGVFQDDVFLQASFIYTHAGEANCYDPCVFSEWDLVGAWECLGPTRRPAIPPAPPSLWEPNTSTPIGPFTIYANPSPPFEEGVYEAGVYFSWDTLWVDYEGARVTLIHSYFLHGERAYIKPLDLPLALEDLFEYIKTVPEPTGFRPCQSSSLAPCEVSTIAYNLLGPCNSPEEVTLATCINCTPSLVNGFLHRWVYRDGEWYSQFFVKGAGPKGIAYTLDIGYLHPLCPDQIVIKEDNIPLYPDGTFKIPLVDGPLYIRLKAFSLYGWTTVGEYKGVSDLPRTWEATKTLWYEDNQYTYVKDTAISLILLLLSPYYPDHQCQGTYGWRPPYFLDYVGKVLRQLVSLIYRQPGKAQGSIPYRVYSHSSYEALYNTQAISCPDVYLSGVFEANCMEDFYWGDEFLWVGDALPSKGCDCFDKGYKGPPIELDIDSEAIGWLMYACGVYTHLDYDQGIVDGLRAMANYLYSIRDRKTGLVPKSHLDDQTSTQVNSIVSIAFMKAYDVLQEAPLLETASDMYWALNEYLYLAVDQTFYHDLDTPEGSIDSILNSLMFSWQVNKVDAIEKSISSITTKGYPCLPSPLPVTTQSGNPIRLRSNAALTSPSSCNRTVPFQGGGEDMTHWVLFKVLTNTLIRDDYRVSYAPLASNHKVYRPGLLHQALCLTQEGVGLDNHLTKIQCLSELERVLFYRHYVYNQLKYMWPTDFQTWASSPALTLKGLIGRTLNTTAIAIATWYGFMYSFVLGVYLEEGRVAQLDTWGDDLSLTRYVGEDDSHYRQRLSYILKNLDDSRGVDLVSLAGHLGYYMAQVSQPRLQGTLSSRHPHQYFSPNLDAYLQGGDAVSNVATLSLVGNLTKEDNQRFQRAKAAGVKFYIQDVVSFGDCHRVREAPPCVNWVGEALPIAQVEPYCCASGNPCGDPWVSSLSHQSSRPVYVWAEGGGFHTGYELPDGVEFVELFMPGEIRKVTFR
jgi:hypothetical protein